MKREMRKIAVVLTVVALPLALSSCLLVGFRDFLAQAAPFGWGAPEYEVEEIVLITSVSIGYSNSAGLTDVDVTLENVFQLAEGAESALADSRTIEYAKINVRAYNRVGDLITEDFSQGRGPYSTCWYTGRLEMGQSESRTWEIGYFSGVDSVTAELKSVTMMDGNSYSTDDGTVVRSADMGKVTIVRLCDIAPER